VGGARRGAGTPKPPGNYIHAESKEKLHNNGGEMSQGSEEKCRPDGNTNFSIKKKMRRHFEGKYTQGVATWMSRAASLVGQINYTDKETRKNPPPATAIRRYKSEGGHTLQRWDTDGWVKAETCHKGAEQRYCQTRHYSIRTLKFKSVITGDSKMTMASG